MRVIPPSKGLSSTLPRRLRWTRARVPTRRRIPRLYRPEGRVIARPSATASLLQSIAFLAVVGVVWSAGALFQTAYAGRIYPHVSIDGVPVGGMTRDEALAALRVNEASRVNAPLLVRAADHTWQVTPARFGARYDLGGAVDRALALAHTGPFISGGWNEATTIARGANVPLRGAHDPAAAARFLAAAERAVHVPPQGAVVGVRGGDVAILRDPAPGHRLDLPGASAALGDAIDAYDATNVTLPLQRVDSALGYDEAADVMRQARSLLSATIQVQFGAGNRPPWELTRPNMLRLLTFAPRCYVGGCRFDLDINRRKLAAAFDASGVSAAVDRLPTPASYQLYPASDPLNSSVGVLPESIGNTINVDRAAFDILQQANAAPPRVVYLPTLPVLASFKAGDAQALNFNRVVGSALLTFPGLDWARLRNLDQATDAISNTIVAPGSVFRLARLAGPLIAANGYVAGQNSIGAGDITGANSGVDGTASAILRTAYDAGFPIVRRAPYPYVSAFAPPGLDAMVSYGQRGDDLVFRNTSSHPILVMTARDGAGSVDIYIFNSDGYAPSRAQGPYSSAVSAPRVTLNGDGSVDVTRTRTVTVPGHASATDSLSSHYAPIDP